MSDNHLQIEQFTYKVKIIKTHRRAFLKHVDVRYVDGP